MGRARLQSPDFPSGDQTGQGRDLGRRPAVALSARQRRQPQCAIALESPEELAALDLPAIGPEIEHHQLFPNRTNVSWFAVLEPGRIRARIFERGVGETSASGTGASGAAVTYSLSGGPARPTGVTVVLDGGELEVGVGEDLAISLTGSAQPVFKGQLSPEFMEVLK